MRQRKVFLSILLALAGLGLAWIFGHLGFSLAVAGHGSGVLGYLFYSPMIGASGHYFSAGLVLWFVLGLLAPWCEKPLVWNLVGILLVVSYVEVIRDILKDMNDGAPTVYLAKDFHSMPVIVLLVISVYLSLQITIVSWLFHRRLHRPDFSQAQ